VSGVRSDPEAEVAQPRSRERERGHRQDEVVDRADLRLSGRVAG
jgi:hypothetical protein